MSDIISSWLMKQIGVVESWDEDHTSSTLAKLLLSYTLLTDEEADIIVNKSSDQYENSLEIMRLTINGLGIHISQEEYQDVLNGRGTALTRLLYEMYLLLHDKDATHFLLAQKMHGLQKSRFSIEAVESSTQFSFEKFNNPLAKALDGKEVFIEHQINKYLELMEKCKESRQAYLSFINEKELETEFKTKKIPLSMKSDNEPSRGAECDLPIDAVSLDQSATELIKEAKRVQNMPIFQPNPEKAKQIIAVIQKRSQKIMRLREDQVTFQRKILSELWDKLLKDQEDYFHKEFLERLQQQSLYEQQMTECLVDVHKKRDELVANKYQMMVEKQRQEEDAFIAHLIDEQRKKVEERKQYYLERQRKKELHRLAYEAKKKKRKTRIRKECESITKDVLDIAFYNIGYKGVTFDAVPRQKRDDLARLFISKQPIFDQIEDVGEVVDVSSATSSMDNDSVDVLAVNELERQTAMDDLTFEDYHTFKWPWDYTSWMEFADFNSMTSGMRVIGHIVHRLLTARNPKFKRQLTSASLPKCAVTACVNGLHNLEVLPALNELLKTHNIKIIMLQDAYQYCTAIFKDEMTGDNTTQTEEKRRASDKPGKKKNFNKTSKKGSKSSSEKIGKVKKSKSKLNFESVTDDKKEGMEMHEDKSVQTPRQFPEEEVVLSAAGQVGQKLCTAIDLGEPPNEQVSAQAIVAYLNSLKLNEINGWVLLNFPQTIQQAIALEETINGAPFPYDFDDVPRDCNTECAESGEEKSAVQKYTSRIVEYVPTIDEDVIDYDTYLTAFIELKSHNGDDPDELYHDSFMSAENKSVLAKFYEDQGCKYSLFYESIDFPTVKHLAKLIVGDFSMPLKDSIALFPETLTEVEEHFQEFIKPAVVTSQVVKSGEKKTKKRDVPKDDTKDDKKTQDEKKKTPKDSKGKDSDKSSGGKKSGKPKSIECIDSADNKSDKETQVPTPVPELDVALEPEQAPAKPGDYRWTYYDLPILETYEDALGTLWENLEEVYLIDIKQLFFRRRLLLDSIAPYNAYVKENLLQFIARPDAKQKHLQEFQLLYNEFDDDLREDQEVKAELHMRIDEFREKLWKLCDARMLENESERVRVIQENWFTTLLMELYNIYVSMVQIELDRNCDTCQLIIDYYTTMITNLPSTDDPIEKTRLDTLTLPSNVEEMDHIAPFMEHIEELLLKYKPPVLANDSPFIHMFMMVLKQGMIKLDSNLKVCKIADEKLQGRFKGSGKSPKAKTTSGPVADISEEVAQRASELLQELEAAYMGEIQRCKLRFNILEHVLIEEIHEVMEKSSKNFIDLYKNIESRYRSEMYAVDEAVRLLKRAVEEETKIQPELLLQNDTFYVKIGTLLYESPLPDDDSVPVREHDSEISFTIKQLMRITDILFNLAPNGIIPERSFAFVLQDLMVYDAEDGKEDFVPKMWKKLEPYKTHQLMAKMFGDTEYINWKDFILYCFEIRFPSQNEIMSMRIMFRALDPDLTEFIYEHQYPAITFWFETDTRQPRTALLRQLLYRLYKVGDRLNYTALLLGFCKDRDPVIGLTKAIEVSIGKLVCHDEERGSVRFARSLKHIMRREFDEITKRAERVHVRAMSRELVEQLIDETIHRTNSAVLTAMEEPNMDLDFLCPDEIMQYLNIPSAMPPVSVCSEMSKTTMVSGFGSENHIQDMFSLCSQAHIAVDPIEFQIPFDIIMNVFSVVIPWIHKINRFGDFTFHERFAMIYNSLINEDITIAYFYQVTMNEEFQRMLKLFYNFYSCDVSHQVLTLLSED